MKRDDIYRLAELLVKGSKENIEITSETSLTTLDRSLKKALKIYDDPELDSMMTRPEKAYRTKYILPLYTNESNKTEPIKLCTNTTNLSIITVIFFAVHMAKSSEPYYDFRSKNNMRISLDGFDWVESLRMDCLNAIDTYYGESLKKFNVKHENSDDYNYKLSKFNSRWNTKVEFISIELINLLSISYKLILLYDSKKTEMIKKSLKELSDTIARIDNLPIDDQYTLVQQNLKLIKKFSDSLETAENKIKTDAKKVKLDLIMNKRSGNMNDNTSILAKEIELLSMQKTDGYPETSAAIDDSAIMDS